MTFASPLLLRVGVALALLGALAIWRHARRRRRLAEYLGGRRAAHRLSGRDLYRLPLERIVLLGVAALALAASAAEPRWQAPDIEPHPVRHVVLALDISASMQVKDVSPSRLAQAVTVAADLVGTLEGNRVGLMLFAGSTYLLAPLTYDHEALTFLLGGMTPTMVSEFDPGTLVSVAIREAVALLPADGEVDGERTIILIGDGDSSEDVADAVAAAGEAVAQGIEIYTVGIGTVQGGGMVMPHWYRAGPIVDVTGTPAISRVGESRLRQLAEAGEGAYVHAGDDAQLLGLYRSLEPPPREPPPIWTAIDLSLWLSVSALLLLLTESLLDVRLPRRTVAPVRRIA